MGNRGGVLGRTDHKSFTCLTEEFGFYTEDHRELLGNFKETSFYHGELIVQVRRPLRKFL